MNKNISIKQQEQAVKILNDIKVDIYASFVIDPSFTRREFDQLIAYVRKLKISYAALLILIPLPGTKLFGETEEPEFYDFMHTVLQTTLPLKEFYSEYVRILLKVSPILRYLELISKFDRNRRLSTMRELLRIVKDVREGYKWYQV